MKKKIEIFFLYINHMELYLISTASVENSIKIISNRIETKII